MRWSLVLVVLVVAGAALFTLLSGDRRAGAGRGAEEAAVEALASGAREALVAPTAAEAKTAETAPSTARAELPDYAPRVRGVVRVEDGGELGEDVTLQVDAYTSPVAQPEALDVQVAADGSFTFLPPARTSFVMLELRAERLYTPTEVRAVPGGEVVVVALRRVPKVELAQDLVVSGVVLDEDGQPFANVTIYTGKPGSSSWEGAGVASDAEGRFELAGLARKRWRIGISSQESLGRAHLDIDGTQGDVRGLVLTLERGGCIEGTVRWPDGTLVSDFELSARGEHVSKWSTYTGGEFRVCGLPEELEWTVEVTARTGEVMGSASVPAVPGEAALSIVLETKDTFAVEVSVYGPDGEAVQDAEVWGFSGSRCRTRNFSSNTRTGARGDGLVLLGGLTTGEWTIHARAEGYEEARQEVALAPGSPGLAFKLERSARVRGIVLDPDGNVVSGAEVTTSNARWAWVETDALGNFELSCSPGVAVLRAKRTDIGASDPLELTLVSGRATEGVVLRLLPAARLEGRVHDVHGAPLSGAFVTSPGFDEPARTGEDGAFTVDCLPAGTFEISAGHAGGQARATVTLIRGQTSTIDLRIPK
jgi:hypothetical protein